MIRTFMISRQSGRVFRGRRVRYARPRAASGSRDLARGRAAISGEWGDSRRHGHPTPWGGRYY